MTKSVKMDALPDIGGQISIPMHNIYAKQQRIDSPACVVFRRRVYGFFVSDCRFNAISAAPHRTARAARQRLAT